MSEPAGERLIAIGQALIALCGPDDPSWLPVVKACGLAAGLVAMGLLAWFALRRWLAARTAVPPTAALKETQAGADSPPTGASSTAPLAVSTAAPAAALPGILQDRRIQAPVSGKIPADLVFLAAILQALTPLAVASAVVIPLCPLLTKLGPPQVSMAGWVVTAVGIAIVTRVLLRLIDAAAGHFQRRAAQTETTWDDLLVEIAWQGARTAVLFGVIYSVTTLLVMPDSAKPAMDVLLGLAVIGLIAWLFVALVGIGDRFLKHRFRIDVPDNLQARRVYTQLMVLRRMAYLVIGIVALSLALMQFDGIRQIGTSIIASAGLAGVILGFAAQRTLANLLAGIQIALTQPLRIDDVVIMEGENGRIEEVTLTYVVVALWDQRRLIMPLSRIIENPFQNWTRTGSRLLGTVTMRCDFTVPLDDMRSEAKRVTEADARWNRQAFGFQVTDWAERTVEVRVLLSADDSGKLFDLRCAIREALLRWLSEHAPTALPRLRMETPGPAADGK